MLGDARRCSAMLGDAGLERAFQGETVVARPVRHADSDLTTRADTEKQRQILVNILSNAVEVTAVGGTVKVSAAQDGPDVRMAVSDTGIGISDTRMDAIRDLTHTQDGTGLGLTISRDLTRAMNGDLSATSDVGRGSVFTLTLPRA